MDFSELTDPEMFEAVNGDWNPTIALGFYSPTTLQVTGYSLSI